MPGWQDKDPCVYFLASKRDGVLYTGVTTELFERVSAHRQNLFEGFTKKYNVHMLVYYELHDHMDAALLREARIKKWQRACVVAAQAKPQPNRHWRVTTSPNSRKRW